MLKSCNECPYKGKPQVPYEGNVNANIIIMGEAPNTEELKQGKPFRGRSGQVVNTLLKSIGIKREDVFIVNAVRCQIDKIKDDTKTINTAIKCCKVNVEKVITNINPKLIVCLGTIATQQILGLKKIIENRGRFFEGFNIIDKTVKPLILPAEFKLKQNIIPVFVTVHPAYVLRGATKGFPDKPLSLMSSKEKLIFSDFSMIGEFLKTGIPKIDTSNYKEASLIDMKKILSKDIVALDFELSSLDHDTSKLLSISFCVEEGEARVVIFPSTKRMHEQINKVLTNPKSKKLFAARPFDEIVAKKKLGVEIAGYKHDVLSIAHLLDENYFRYNLESVANVYCPLKNIKEIIGGDRGNLEKVNRERLMKYNCVDSDATFRVYNSQRKDLMNDKKLLRYYTKFLNPVQDMFADLYYNGCKVDKEILKNNEDKALKKVEKLHKKAIAMIPKILQDKYKDNLVLSRPALLIDTLFSKEGFGYTPISDYITEKTEKPQTTENHLKYFSDHPFVETILKWKKLTKVLSYFPTLWEDIKTDGCIYPNTVFTRTVTGRIVMLNPPILTYPERGEYAHLLKEAIVAKDGWLIGERDLSQSELRIIGWLANDRNILDALRNKIDLHTKTASIITGVSIDKITKDMRQKAKAVNFGFCFDMSENGFMQYAKDEYDVTFTYDEACKAKRDFFGKPNGYYSLPVYHGQQRRLIHEQGYVETILGRKRRLPDIYSDDKGQMKYAERQAINFPVQGFSSDLGMIGMLMCHKELKSSPHKAKRMKLLWHRHDAESFTAEKDFMPTAMELMKECMEERAPEYIKKEFGVEVGYPIESEGKFGKNLVEIK